MKKKSRIASTVLHLIILAGCAALLAAAAYARDHKILGHDFNKQTEGTYPQVMILKGDALVIDTTTLAADAIGYGGTIPLKVAFVHGQIAAIESLPNEETPGFYRRIEENLLPKYIGMTAESVLTTEVDAVSGATYSSAAFAANVKAAAAYATAHGEELTAQSPTDWRKILTPGYIASIAVVVMGMTIPIFTRSRKYRIAQLALNVGILGFWGVEFINFTLMLNLMANGLTLAGSIVVLLMLTAAFIYPFFGLNAHYCNWICPLGALQELAGDCNTKYKWHLPAKVINRLNTFRKTLWAALMIMLFIQATAGWVDYELFGLFALSAAGTAVLVVGGVFIVLSLFIPRPYCRFVCPTGTFMRL